MNVVCAVCSTEFAAKRSTAKYCSDRCRQLAKRRRVAGPETDTDGDVEDRESYYSELVQEIRKELTRMKQLHTVDGQLAVELAIKITTPGMTGVAGLSKELRNLRGQIRMTAAPPKPTGPTPKDQVGEARKRREQKTRQARARRA